MNKRPSAGVMQALGADFVGEKYILPRESLEKYLGWDIASQARGYSGGLVRKIKRLLG
jgi:hypothetical protein